MNSAQQRTVVLSIRDVSAAYGTRPVLHDLSLSIAGGEAHCLLGPNGAGKTTLIRAILGRVRLGVGEINIAPGGVGLVPQDIALFPRLTVRENLQAFGRLAGVPRREIAKRVSHTAELTGIADYLTDVVENLSGGWQRRVNIAAAVLNRPGFLILDEPTVGVDSAARRGLHTVIRDLRAKGLGILMTTHDMSEAEAVCSHVLLLDEGRVRLSGSLPDVLKATFGQQLLLSVFLDPDAAAPMWQAVNDMGLLIVGNKGFGLVEDEPHAFEIVSQLRQQGVPLVSLRLERPGLATLIDRTGSAAT